jgi:cell division septal protein FtsQ
MVRNMLIRGRGRRRSQRRLGVQYHNSVESYALGAMPIAESGRISRLLAMGLLVVLVWAVYSVFTSSSFYVSGAEVRGNVAITADEVYAASGLDGMSIFWVDTEEAMSRIEALPDIKSAWVSAMLPAEVTITIEERMPRLVWQAGDVLWWIDPEGTVLAPRGVLEGAITIKDLDAEPLAPGDKLSPTVLASIRALNSLLPRLTEMHYSHERGIGFKTQEGWPVFLGDEHGMQTKLTVLLELRKRLLEQKTVPNLIDVRFPQGAYYK